MFIFEKIFKMTLIKSISGIRGTIGGFIGDNLTPIDIVKYASAYGIWLKSKSRDSVHVVIGRDARISGIIVQNLVESSLQSLGIHIIDIGMSTTPTVEIAVAMENASGVFIYWSNISLALPNLSKINPGLISFSISDEFQSKGGSGLR